MALQGIFCCKELEQSISPERSMLFYHPVFEEFGIPFSTEEGFSYMTIGYCPWCGKPLPESKREQWIKAKKEEQAKAESAE